MATANAASKPSCNKPAPFYSLRPPRGDGLRIQFIESEQVL